ncbi:putative non-specific serine/threonine protein kinase [Helianthus anomalus]
MLHFAHIIGLTCDTGVPSSSSTFLNPTTNSTTSLSTQNPNGMSSSGDGVSFFLPPNNHTIGSPDGFLGLVNSTQLTENKFFAIEFDTRLDTHFNDPNDNHVGLDINSFNSIKTIDCSLIRIDVKNESHITAWIDYWYDGNNLKVLLSESESNKKPIYPILDVDIGLSLYFQEVMYLRLRVGASLRSIEVQNDVGDRNKKHKKIGLAVGVLGQVCRNSTAGKWVGRRRVVLLWVNEVEDGGASGWVPHRWWEGSDWVRVGVGTIHIIILYIFQYFNYCLLIVRVI